MTGRGRAMSFGGVVVKEEPLEDGEEMEEKASLLSVMAGILEETEKSKGGSSSKQRQSAEEMRRKQAEGARARRKREAQANSKLTPEEDEERRRKQAERKNGGKSEEELERRRRRDAETKKRRLEAMTPEELEAMRKRKVEYDKQRRLKMSEERKAELRRRHAEGARRRRAEGKVGGNEAAEDRRRREQFNRFVRRAHMTEEEREDHRMKLYLYRQAWYANKGRWRDRPEEEKERKRKRWREWSRNLSGEKRERYLESTRRAVKKYQERLKVEHGKSYWEKMKLEQPEQWRERHEKYLESLRTKYANETPEERERRRHKEKVNAARRRLKKRLEGEGVDKEEIGRRDEELKVKLWKEFDPEGEVPGNRPGGKRRKRVKTLSVIVDRPGSSSQLSPSRSPASRMFPPSPDQDNVILSDDFGDYGDSIGVEKESENVGITLQCSHCSSTFPTATHLQGHIRFCHPEKCWKCPKCGDVALSPQQLSQHYQTSHKKTEDLTLFPQISEARYFCMRCPPSLATNGQFHLTGFKSRSELLAHVNVMHPEHYWACERCHLLKYSEPALQLHLSVCRPK